LPEDLLRFGLQVSDKPSLMDVAAAFSGTVDRYVYQGDGLTPDTIRRFVLVAFKKMRAELRKRRDTRP
jgi:hypothetical protein